jgi:chromosomal replication initiation ATPase DnaA
MSRAAYDSPILREITAALAAAGCGIIRRPPPTLPDLPAQSAEVETIRDELIRKDLPYPSMKTLLRIVSVVTGIPAEHIMSSSRKVPICRARQIYMFVARDVTGRSLPAIGRAIGGLDHSTVLHGVRKVTENRQYFEPELSKVLDLVRPQS